MKSKLFISVLVFAGLLSAGAAQEKNVRKAKNLLGKQNLTEAVTLIDAAVQNQETASSFEAWWTRGKIYMAIAANPLLARNYANPADVAKESLEKAAQLDPGKVLMMRQDFLNLAGMFYDQGANAFGEKAYSEALVDFEKSAQISQMEGIYDTNAVFNAALCAFNAEGELETSIKYFKEVVDAGWNNATACIYLAEAYLMNEQNAEAQATMDAGLQTFPEDKNMYLSASSIYIRTGENEKASTILNAALIKWASDPTFQRYLGVSYQNEGKEAEAETAFKKAIELDPEYMDAYIDLGNLYLQKGNRLSTEANELPLDEAEKYDAMMTQAKESFALAVPYLEKILTQDPNNLPVLQILREIYVRVGDMAKANELKAKIDELSGTGAAE